MEEKIKEEENEKNDKDYAEWQVTKDIDEMERDGAFNNPEQYEREAFKKELAKKYKIFQYKKIKDKETGEVYKIKSGITYPNLAELILNEYGYNFLTTTDTKEMYFYRDGFFHPKGETVTRAIAEDFMGKMSSKHAKNEIDDYIRDKNYQERQIFNASKHLIPLENGVYNLDIKQLMAHSPIHYFINKIPVKFDIDADCPKIKEFISEIVDEKDVMLVQEFIGYCLYRSYPYHKAAMFLGSGKNGKSTLIELIKCFLGEKNVANKELQDLANDRFASSKLYGRLLNAAADISDAALQQTGKFKALTGGDTIDAQKKFQDSFYFKNYAKLLYSANTLPKTNDDSYAFYRRWILINFSNTFVGKNCDPYILDKITTEQELSGLLNWALEGLDRLFKNKEFTYRKTVEQTRDQYKMLSDPVYSFVHTFISTDTTGYLLKDDVYGKFVEFCEEKDLPVTPKNMFSKDLAKHVHNMRPGRKQVSGHSEQVYLYICWKKAENGDFEGNPTTSPQQERFE